jgi:2-aminoadipate transaminase
VKQAVDLHTATLAQGVALQLLTQPGFMADHVRVLQGYYGDQARVLCGALVTEFGDQLEFAPPDGGMFVWARVRRPGVDTEALLRKAIDNGVAFVPGSAFTVTEPHHAYLRLSFAAAPPEDLVEGARRLARIVLDGLRDGGRHSGCRTASPPVDRYN